MNEEIYVGDCEDLINEIIEWLDSELDYESKELILKSESVIKFHLNIGMTIRNKFLWNKKRIFYFLSSFYGIKKESFISYPDDISYVVLERYKEHLQKNRKEFDQCLGK